MSFITNYKDRNFNKFDRPREDKKRNTNWATLNKQNLEALDKVLSNLKNNGK